jgi:hypothetical protein
MSDMASVVTTTETSDPIIREGQEAWSRLVARERHTWDDWKAVGEALRVGRHRAMLEAGTNEPTGSRYNDVFGQWLKATGFDAVDKAARSYLFECLEHLAEIETWRQALPIVRRLELNHPKSVLFHWRRSLAPAADNAVGLSPVAQLKQTIARLENENYQLRSAGNDLFSAGDSAANIARLLADLLLQRLSPAKVRQIVGLLPDVIAERAKLQRDSMNSPTRSKKRRRTVEDFRRDLTAKRTEIIQP